MDPAPPRLRAVFRPQAWIRDQATDVDGRVEFDATAAFLRLDLKTVRRFRASDYDSDALADDLPARRAHDGPFEVDVDVDAWLEALGAPARADLSADDLEGLRRRFGVLPPSVAELLASGPAAPADARPGKIFLLLGWRKPGEDGHVVLGACREKAPLLSLISSLNDAAGYRAGEGLWDRDETRGYFSWSEVEPLDPGRLYGELYRKGLAFLRHEDER